MKPIPQYHAHPLLVWLCICLFAMIVGYAIKITQLGSDLFNPIWEMIRENPIHEGKKIPNLVVIGLMMLLPMPLAYVMLFLPMHWQRIVVGISYHLVYLALVPLFVLAGYVPELQVPLISITLSAVGSMVYALNHSIISPSKTSPLSSAVSKPIPVPLDLNGDTDSIKETKIQALSTIPIMTESAESEENTTKSKPSNT